MPVRRRQPAHLPAGLDGFRRRPPSLRAALSRAVFAAGRYGLARAYSLACAADLWALQAQAHAALGESRDDEPEWARFIDIAYLAGEWATAFGDIAQRAFRLSRCGTTS